MGGEPDAETRADEQVEREAWGIAEQDWDAAFSWADETPDGSEPDPDEAVDGEPAKVWRCNWEAAGLFLACETQWHKDAMGRADGLRYPGIEVVMRRKGVKDKDAMFDKLQVMEAAALEVLRG